MSSHWRVLNEAQISGVSAGKERLWHKHLPCQSLQFIAGETNRAMKHLLAGQQALQRPSLLEAIQRPVGTPAPSAMLPPNQPWLCTGSALSLGSLHRHPFPALLNLLWFLFLRIAHNSPQFENRPTMALSTSHFKHTTS